MTDTIIVTHDLTKDYRGVRAVDTLSIEVRRGTAYGLLGPNGSGKTTAIQMLLGNVRPTAGKAWLFGKAVGNRDVRKQVGFLPERISFYPFLTAHDVLRKSARSSGVRGAQLDTRIEAVLAKAGLADRARERIGGYSRGMVQRLGLAQALLNEPELLILDEPTALLDPLGRRDLREIILSLKQSGCTVLLGSNLLSEVETTCDEIAVLTDGRIIVDGRVSGLLAFNQTVNIEVDGMNDAAMAALRAIAPKFKMFGMPPTRFTAYVDEPEDVPAIAHAIVSNGVRLLALTPQRETLEEMFVRVVSSEG